VTGHPPSLPGTRGAIRRLQLINQSEGQALSIHPQGHGGQWATAREARELLGESSWDVVAQRGFDQPRQFLAYLNTLRWNCVTATANCLRLRMAS
jgi:hypothetical protein